MHYQQKSHPYPSLNTVRMNGYSESITPYEMIRGVFYKNRYCKNAESFMTSVTDGKSLLIFYF